MRNHLKQFFLFILLVTNQLLFAENSVESPVTTHTLSFSNNKQQSYREASLEEKWDTLMLANVCYPSVTYGEALGELISKTGYTGLIKSILNYSTANIVPFLVKKVKSDRRTEIHICNSFNASEGFIALCYLQIVRDKRWHEYKGTNAELNLMIQKNRSMTSETFNPIYKEPSCLNKIATEKKLRNVLIEYLIEDIDQDTTNHGAGLQTVWEKIRPTIGN